MKKPVKIVLTALGILILLSAGYLPVKAGERTVTEDKISIASDNNRMVIPEELKKLNLPYNAKILARRKDEEGREYYLVKDNAAAHHGWSEVNFYLLQHYRSQTKKLWSRALEQDMELGGCGSDKDRSEAIGLVEAYVKHKIEFPPNIDGFTLHLTLMNCVSRKEVFEEIQIVIKSDYPLIIDRTETTPVDPFDMKKWRKK